MIEEKIKEVYKGMRYRKVRVCGVSVLHYDDNSAIINDVYDSKKLGLRQKYRNVDELIFLIKSRIGEI